MSEPVTDLVPVEPQETGIVRASADVELAVAEYQRIQDILDKAMPECIVNISGKDHRKKMYWMGVATAFNIDVELLGEPRKEVLEDGDWGYLAMARATAPNGRRMDGDGACFASEKKGMVATVHNVRAHAATRAINRAISNLVGFGEVSADEINRDAPAEYHPPAREYPTQEPPRESAAPEGETWLRTNMIGKKYAGKTWEWVSEGSVGGERYSYLEYMAGWLREKIKEDPDGKWAAKNENDLGRVVSCLAIINDRAQSENSEADAGQPELGDAGAF